jgi:hypothetical protein
MKRAQVALTTLGVTVAVLAGACGGVNEPQDVKSAISEEIALRSGVVTRVLEAQFDLEVVGSLDATWHGSVPLSITSSVGGNTPKEFWLLTVGILPQDAIHLADREVRTAFDLLGYAGPGRYSIQPDQAGGLSDEELAAIKRDPTLLDRYQSGSLRSAAFIDAVAGDKLTRFDQLSEPCVIDVAAQGTNGSIRCPSVSDGTAVVSFSWSWRADPEKNVERDESPASATTVTGSPDEVGSSAPSTTTAPATTATTATTAPRPRSTRRTFYSPFKLNVHVDPKCATRGSVATVKVDTIVDAFITLAMAYPDGQTHGGTATGTTGPTGKYNWAFLVDPTVPDGDAQLLVNVTRQDGSESGGGIVAAFEVREQC